MGQLRPVDLARRYGLSAQAVRNYEAVGILPDAERTPSGYRVYTPLHGHALGAFLALVAGHGHQTATAIMQAINHGAAEDALRLIDESHAGLLDDRRTLRAVEAALGGLSPVPGEHGGAFIGPLARRLGLRPATLRKWERAGLLQPRRAYRPAAAPCSPEPPPWTPTSATDRAPAPMLARLSSGDSGPGSRRRIVRGE